MGSLLKIKDNLDAAAYIIVGLVTLALSLLSICTKYIDEGTYGITKGNLLTIAIMGILIVLLGRERLIQRNKVENKLERIEKNMTENYADFFRYVEGIKGFEIIEGHKNISDEVNKNLGNAHTYIKATSFKNVDGEDSPEKYYSILGSVIRDKDIKYICCYNKGHSFKNRKKAFLGLDFGEDEFRKMTYYEFSNQSYFNFLLIDSSIAFIGFPKFGEDQHMNIVLKIIPSTEKNKMFLQGLSSWYDRVLLNPMKNKANNTSEGTYIKMDTQTLF